VIFVSNLLYGLIALVSFIIAGYLFFAKRGETGGSLTPLIIAIILIVVGLVFGGLFLSGRVNKTEDIHITE
jgi:hypothetical protein